jgi:PAS domain-containing protein
MNPAAQLLTGWNLKDGVGKKLSEIYDIVNGGNNEPIETHIKNSTQEIFRFEQVVQKVLIDKYGIQVPVEDNYKFIKDNNGNTIGCVLVFRDTINQMWIENALKMALKDWQNIFNAISDGVLILDPEGCKLQSNRVIESIIGMKTENIIGQHFYDIMHCFSDFIKYDLFERMKQNRMRESFEFEDRELALQFQVMPAC